VPCIASTRQRLAHGYASILPPLQKALWNRELDKVLEDLQDKAKGNTGGKPKTTPRPSSTPLPKPGPSPTALPVYSTKISDTTGKITGSSVQRIQNVYEALLDVDTSNLSARDRKALELISRQIDSGSFTQSQLNTYYQALDRIRSKAKYLEKAVSDSKSDATWGTKMINNQNSYSQKAGTFGPFGSIAKNGCGAIAINNANQALGFNTEFGDLVHNLNQRPDLTTNLFGIAGMNPLVIGDYYRQNGAEVTLYTNPADVPTDHDAYIALYFHSKGGHYVAARYDQFAHEYEVYNLFENGRTYPMNSLSDSDFPAAEDTNHWIIWGIDSPVNTNDGYSNSPFSRENQDIRRYL